MELWARLNLAGSSLGQASLEAGEGDPCLWPVASHHEVQQLEKEKGKKNQNFQKKLKFSKFICVGANQDPSQPSSFTISREFPLAVPPCMQPSLAERLPCCRCYSFPIQPAVSSNELLPWPKPWTCRSTPTPGLRWQQPRDSLCRRSCVHHGEAPTTSRYPLQFSPSCIAPVASILHLVWCSGEFPVMTTHSSDPFRRRKPLPMLIYIDIVIEHHHWAWVPHTRRPKLPPVGQP